MFKNKLQNIVLNFQKVFGHPVETKPTLPSIERFTNRKGWGAIEEATEQLYIISNNDEEFIEAIEKLKMFLDKAKETQLKKPRLTGTTERLTALADGLGDELWFLLGDCVEAGIDIEPVIEIIEASNLSKQFTDENGNKYVKNNEFGKVIKSPDFFPPEDRIFDEIKKQLLK